MSERLIFRTGRLPKEVLVIDPQAQKKLYLLKCSRRKLGQLIDALAGQETTPIP